MSAPDRVFLDTNVLIAATDESRRSHTNALRALNELPLHFALNVSGQVIREYVGVATRPIDANGLGLSIADAVANARAFLARSVLLDETEDVCRRLMALVAEHAVCGKQVHDANLVATMTAHDVATLLTDDVTDFQRFDAVHVVGLERVGTLIA